VKKSRVDELQWTMSTAWRRVTRDHFESHLAASRLCSNLDALSDLSVDDLAKLYHDVLIDLLDRHCPIVTVRRRTKLKTPCFDADYRATRRRARAMERRFRRSRSDDDGKVWVDKLKAMPLLYEEKNNVDW